MNDRGTWFSRQRRRLRTATSWLFGLAAAVAIGGAGSQLTGPVTCRDGWQSPSIGRRGACSHHGGVDRSGRVWLFMALGGGVLGGLGFYHSALGYRLGGEQRRIAPRPGCSPSGPAGSCARRPARESST